MFVSGVVQSAYPDLSPNKAASQDTAKTLVTSRSEKEGERPTTGRVGAAEADTAGRGVQEGGRGTSGLKSLALARGPKDAHGHAESESVPQDANALSISVGRDGAALGTRADGPYKGSTDHTGKMLWGGLDGEQISPRHFHRKRTDLTSRGQARMGYGMKPSEVDYTVKVQERPVLGQKRVKTKRLKQKQFAESIASATELHRPKSGGLGLGMPNHSALPLNRPSEANWAYQTLYMPKTVVHWNPGNVSKIVRNINYEQERPTFGPHFSSN